LTNKPSASYFHLSADGKRFAMLNYERSDTDIWVCRIYDWQQKKLEREFRGDVAGLTLSPDFRSFIAIQHRGGLDYAHTIMYDAQTGKKKWELKHQGQINGAQISPIAAGFAWADPNAGSLS